MRANLFKNCLKEMEKDVGGLGWIRLAICLIQSGLICCVLMVYETPYGVTCKVAGMTVE